MAALGKASLELHLGRVENGEEYVRQRKRAVGLRRRREGYDMHVKKQVRDSMMELGKTLGRHLDFMEGAVIPNDTST